MTTSSAKAKGRRFQQFVCKALLEIGKEYGLEADDIKSTSMGVSGRDVLLSPAAVKVFGRLDVECKNVEKLVVSTTFYEHSAKYPDGLAVLAHTKNHREPLITLHLKDFMTLLKTKVGSSR